MHKLLSLGVLKHVISQNTDGLHRLSGIPRDCLSELHGNAFHERCDKCGTKYERPFVACTRNSAVPEQVCVHCHCSHRTGRVCERKVSMCLVCWLFVHFKGFLFVVRHSQIRPSSGYADFGQQAIWVTNLLTTIHVGHRRLGNTGRMFGQHPLYALASYHLRIQGWLALVKCGSRREAFSLGSTLQGQNCISVQSSLGILCHVIACCIRKSQV